MSYRLLFLTSLETLSRNVFVPDINLTHSEIESPLEDF